MLLLLVTTSSMRAARHGRYSMILARLEIASSKQILSCAGREPRSLRLLLSIICILNLPPEDTSGGIYLFVCTAAVYKAMPSSFTIHHSPLLPACYFGNTGSTSTTLYTAVPIVSSVILIGRKYVNGGKSPSASPG